MNATATEARPATSGKVNEALFLSIARDYSARRKLIDALIAEQNPDDGFAAAIGVIGRLRHLVSEGSDYTPALQLGFTSANSATIAAGILGDGMTGAQLKKQFATIGKPKK